MSRNALPISATKGDFPATERAARETLALPIYPEISREAQRYVVSEIAKFFS